MDYYELRSFIVLADHLHFGRASAVLNLTQPALTKQIRKLEEEIGTKLFERGSRGTALTTVGTAWLAEVCKLVEQFDRTVALGRTIAIGERGSLRIGFGSSTLDLVPMLIVALKRMAPGLEISLQDMATAEQLSALKHRQLDVGFLRIRPGLDREFASQAATHDRPMLVSRSDQKASSLALCANRPFVVLSNRRSPGFYQHFLRLCAEANFHPRVVQEVTEFTTALAFVRAGLGVTVIPESLQLHRAADIYARPITSPSARWTVDAVWRRKNTNPALATFLKLLRDRVPGRKPDKNPLS